MAPTFDIADPAQHRFVGYGSAEFPDARDELLDTYLAGLIAGGRGAVAKAIASASELGRSVLTAYAERVASRAVRGGDPALLLPGFVGIVVGGLDQDDLESLMRMPLLEDASRRLGVPLVGIVEEAGRILGFPGDVSLVSWLGRAPADRTLSSMGYEAAGDGTGFRYRRLREPAFTLRPSDDGPDTGRIDVSGVVVLGEHDQPEDGFLRAESQVWRFQLLAERDGSSRLYLLSAVPPGLWESLLDSAQQPVPVWFSQWRFATERARVDAGTLVDRMVDAAARNGPQLVARASSTMRIEETWELRRPWSDPHLGGDR